jgi:CheY-like chemotaxis protein
VAISDQSTQAEFTLLRYARFFVADRDQTDRLVQSVMISDHLQDRPSPSAHIRLLDETIHSMDSLAAEDGEIRSPLAKIPRSGRRAIALSQTEFLGKEGAANHLGISLHELDDAIENALETMISLFSAKVMIVEDQPIISMDLEAIVGDFGCGVHSVVRNYDDGVIESEKITPDLVLCDIVLSGERSGIDLAHHIVERYRSPLIFITAFPEKLLIGAPRPEPTFLITKPFQRSTIKQAMFQALAIPMFGDFGQVAARSYAENMLDGKKRDKALKPRKPSWQSAIDDADASLAELESMPRIEVGGAIGHNMPPAEHALSPNEIAALRTGIQALGDAASKGEITPAAAANAQSILLSAMGKIARWAAAKADETASSFASEVGKQLATPKALLTLYLILSGKLGVVLDAITAMVRTSSL